MERHYDSILDRSKQIMWQDDCYVDLHSTSSSISSQAETAGMHNGVIFISRGGCTSGRRQAGHYKNAFHVLSPTKP